MPQCTIKALFMAIFLAGITLAQGKAQQPYQPMRGTAERTAILNAVRPKIEAEMRGPVIFVVRTLRVLDGWAFMQLDPQRPDGRPINPANTIWADDIEMMDGLTVWALARNSTGGWGLVDAVTGPTDVAFFNWPEFYGAPAVIFGFESP